MLFLNADFFFSLELVGGAPRAASLKGKVSYFCQSLFVRVKTVLFGPYIEWTPSIKWTQGVLTIYMGKPEISAGKSNGLCHSIWKASEIWAVI